MVGKDTVEIQDTTEVQSEIGQINLSVPLAQVHGASQGIMEKKDKPRETKLIPKPKEKEAI